MPLNDQEQRIIKELGAKNIPEEDQKILLKLLDERLEKRFMANLLVSLTEDKRNELSQKIESMGELKPEEVIEMVIGLHPDARGVLEKSTLEIIDEMKQDGKIASSQQSDVSGQQPAVGSHQDTNQLPAVSGQQPAVNGQNDVDSQQPDEENQESRIENQDQPSSVSFSPLGTVPSNPPLESADNKE